MRNTHTHSSWLRVSLLKPVFHMKGKPDNDALILVHVEEIVISPIGNGEDVGRGLPSLLVVVHVVCVGPIDWEWFVWVYGDQNVTQKGLPRE